MTISGVWWRFSILEPKKARTPRLNRVRSPSSGGVRQCFDMENVGMLVKFHLHPTRAETDAPPRRYRKGGGFFLKWPNHGTEFSARALKSATYKLPLNAFFRAETLESGGFRENLGG